MGETFIMDEVTSQAIADAFKVFGDKTRVRILFCLLENEQCVDDIAVQLNMEQSAISHQLRILKNARLVSARREGRFSYYSLMDEHVSVILNMGLEHATEDM